MKEIRFHGRGGQGAVVATRILADAAFSEGKDVQAFPFFGVERRGAPVASFTRIDEKKIRIRTQIYEPDYVAVLDPTLLEAVNVIQGLKPGGIVLINTNRKPQDFDLGEGVKVVTCDVTSIAVKYGLGSRAAPIVNTSMLGAFSKATGLVGLESIVQSIRKMVPAKADANIQAAREAYESVQALKG